MKLLRTIFGIFIRLQFTPNLVNFQGVNFFFAPNFQFKYVSTYHKTRLLELILKSKISTFRTIFADFLQQKLFFFKYCVVHLVCSFAVRLLILGSVIYELLLVVLPFMCRSRGSLKSYRFWLPMTVTNLLVLRDAELVHLA